MTTRIFRPGRVGAAVFALSAALGFVWIVRPGPALAAEEPTFDALAKPFLQQNCVRCHNERMAMSGVRLDQLDGSLNDRQLHLWQAVGKRISEQTMPPKGQPQPPAAERERMVEWVNRNLEIARLRPSPKNGMVRRLTVAQYRNTLRELLKLDDDLTEILPPDAISADGFVNNTDTLQLSPLLLEAYFEIAEKALNRAIVDPSKKPVIESFRMTLGESVNPKPFPEALILGANSLLLDNKDFVITEPIPVKPFPFEPLAIRTKYRFIEGYQGNDTVRGWREYDSIYHSIFACMRGSRGYPKGEPYSSVPQGLLLRPAIPNDELFGTDGTYGPKANFKISLRELPDQGRFRVTVKAAKYEDGLLLDSGVTAQAAAPAAITAREPESRKSVSVPKAGIYQVDVYAATRPDSPPAPDASRLTEDLGGNWNFDGDAPGRLEGAAKFVDSPFGRAASLEDGGGEVVIPRSGALNVGTGDFTVSAWIHPSQLRRGGIVGLGAQSGGHGWFLDMPDNRGILRIDTTGPDRIANGEITTRPGVIRANDWQHVAAVVRRGRNQTLLYVNGFPVARGTIGAADLDNPKVDLHIGRIPEAGGMQRFHGQIDEVRIYRRALGEAELQALVEPGRNFVKPPPNERPQTLTLDLGDRKFSGSLQQPAFLAVRLPAGPLAVHTDYGGINIVDRVVLTPLDPTATVTRKFLAFEKRTPRVGVYVGLRRDCGSTFAPVGPPRTVAGTNLANYVFEGAIANFPSPDVEKDNVNYLAGVREIAVHSEYTDGRDMPRLLIRSVDFEGPYYDVWPPAPHKSIFIDSNQKGDQVAYARQILRSFATRAYRRPITPAEESSLMNVFQSSFSSSGLGFEQGIKDALLVVLTSPQFLFLMEKSTTPQPEPISNHELASKLSYFLWNSPPDQTTLNLAANGSLTKQVDAETNRLIADPRFSRFINEFTPQWLSLDKFSVLEPDRKRFPKLTRDIRAQLRLEPVKFFEYLVRNNLPVKDLIDSDFIVANETVADYYGLGDQTESGFGFVPITHRRKELGGVLTEAALMAGLSDGRESNPVKRGAWVARKIIAEPPDPPPPNVPALKEDSAGLTLRQRLEQHRNQPGCMQCHSKIDPWGVALEEFDAAGRLKSGTVDARSTLPDKTEVSGVNELKHYLTVDRLDQVAFSVLKHLTTYATGRSLTYAELHFLKNDSRKLRAGGYRMQDMIRYVVNSKIFLEK